MARHNVRERITNSLGVSGMPPIAPINHISFYANLPAQMDVTTNTRLYGPIQVNSTQLDKPVVVVGDTKPMLSIQLKGNALVLEDDKGQIASFSLHDMVDTLASMNSRRRRTDEKGGTGQLPLVFLPTHGLLNITLVLTEFNGHRKNEQSVDAYAMGFWLVKPLVSSTND